MTILAPSATLALLQAAAVVRDTVIMRPLSPVRSPVETIFFYAAGLSSILVLVILLMVLVSFFWARKAAIAAGRRVDELIDELRPMLAEASETGASVRKTVDLIKNEVASATEGVHETGVRVRQTVGELADRVDDFNDLLERVHSRADSVVTVAGAAIDGLAWGTEKLRERKRKRLRKKAP